MRSFDRAAHIRGAAALTTVRLMVVMPAVMSMPRRIPAFVIGERGDAVTERDQEQTEHRCGDPPSHMLHLLARF